MDKLELELWKQDKDEKGNVEVEWYELADGKALRKKGNNYRIIYPMRNREGRLNFKNVILGGSWSNFFLVLFVLSIIMFTAWGYEHDTRECRQIIENQNNICNFAQPSFINSGNEYAGKLLDKYKDKEENDSNYISISP